MRSLGVQWEHYYTAGDDAMLRLLSELFERGSGRAFRVTPQAISATPGSTTSTAAGSNSGVTTERVVGSVHEVEAVRKRCVEGSVISNLEKLRLRVVKELRRASYAVHGLAEGTPLWLQALQADLHVFVEALLLCTQSRKLSKASLLEARVTVPPCTPSALPFAIWCTQMCVHSTGLHHGKHRIVKLNCVAHMQIWTLAVLHIDQVVLQGLAECVAPEGKFKGFMSNMVSAKSADGPRGKRGLSSDGCMQLASDVGQLVRAVAAAQPAELGSADAFRLMTVPKWAEVRWLDTHPLSANVVGSRLVCLQAVACCLPKPIGAA